MIPTEYPITWKKNNFGIKIYCSIPAIATGIMLTAGETRFLLDPGDGILRDLNEELTGEQMFKISDLFVTHGHHDHVGGIWALLTYFRVMRRSAELHIHYPEGCVEIESIYNAFKSVYSKSTPYHIIMHTIYDEHPFTRKKVKVHPFPVVHREFTADGKSTQLVPSLGYKFTFEGVKICYGGDTAYCDSLAKMAKDADLAVIEAGEEDEEKHDGMHMTKDEALKIAESAKEFCLVHVPD